MRTILLGMLVAVLGCGGSSTATVPDRYNFAVVDGANQVSTAGASALGKPITSQLARDPQGKFASGIFSWLKPTIAYAQTLTVPGTPVAGAIVCGRESNPGEPRVVPLCAFTLADGKAVNAVEGGTKAGTYNILFTAQVPSQRPVEDSTTVTVSPGAPATVSLFAPSVMKIGVGSTLDLHPFVVFVRDQYSNDIDWAKLTPSIAIRNGSEPGEPTPDNTSWTIPWTQSRACSGVLYLYVWFGSVRWPSYMAIEFAC